VRYSRNAVDTILVVEDDADSRRMFKMALSFAGYRVLEAGDGLEALRIIDVEEPRLVVLDLGLPTMSGRVVLQEIAAHAPEVPVVIVTAMPGPHDFPDAECILIKPVTPDKIVETVRRCLASAATARRVSGT
jgi:DNA-binding NtrC family response regulator